MLPRGLRADNDVLEAFEAFIDDRRGHMRTSQLATHRRGCSDLAAALGVYRSAVDASPHSASGASSWRSCEAPGPSWRQCRFATAISARPHLGAYEHAKGAGVAYIFKMTGSLGTRWLSYRIHTVAGDEFVLQWRSRTPPGRRRRRHAARRAYVFTKTRPLEAGPELKGGDTVAATTSLVSVHLGHDCRSGCLWQPRVPVGVLFSESTVGSRSPS